MLVQPSAIRLPTNGMRLIQSGGAGIVAVCNAWIDAVMESMLLNMARTASITGATNTISIRPDITATASERRRVIAWTLSMAGHVATTIITDHATESRNGRRIQ